MGRRIPIIKVRNLEYKMKSQSTNILDVKTLNIYENEILGIVGKFGSGKTTLLRHLNGTLKPQLGDVYIDNRSVKKNPGSPFYQIVGLLMENAEDQIFMDTVVEDIAFGPKNLGLKPQEIEKRVTQAVYFLGIESLLERQIGSLSNGEKKLVALAGVLAMGSSVLLLDNPTEGLDLWTRQYVIDKISKLKENHSIVLTANDWELLKLTDRIIYIEDGSLVRTFYTLDKFQEFIKTEDKNIFTKSTDKS
jgi:energy-coupling factor transporter ATP-binding protein EcfA2